MTEKHPMCAGCQFGPTPDYARGSAQDERAHSLAQTMYREDTLGCHRRDSSDPHFDRNQTVPAFVCGGAEHVKERRHAPPLYRVPSGLNVERGGSTSLPTANTSHGAQQ